MPLLTLGEYPAFMNRCVAGRTKLIAYGSGAMASITCPLRFDYFVSAKPVVMPDFLKNIWPQKPIESLAQENPDRTVIIVCSGTEKEAWKAVSAYGDFPVIRFFSYEFMAPYLAALASLPRTYQRTRKNKTAKRAIILRGQIEGENNFLAIQKIAHDHPDDLVIISTWDDTPKAWLGHIDGVCDRLVASPKPPYAGPQNRNFQLTLAQRGLAAATECGTEKCLISRNDFIFTKTSTLDAFDYLMDKFPLPPDAQARQKGRIIVPHLFTRYCLPYHASDTLAYGWTADVAAFWNASAPDTRPHDDPQYRNLGPETTLDYCTRNKTIIETYLWQNYMQKIGREPLYTLIDWMDFLRDYLLVANLEDQRILWFGKDLRDLTVPVEIYKACVDFNDWLALMYAPPDKSFTDIDLAKVTWNEFGRALGA